MSTGRGFAHAAFALILAAVGFTGGCSPPSTSVMLKKLATASEDRVAHGLAQAVILSLPIVVKARVGHEHTYRLEESDYVLVSPDLETDTSTVGSRRSYYKLFYFRSGKRRGVEIRIHSHSSEGSEIYKIVYPLVYVLDSRGTALDIPLGSIELVREGLFFYDINATWRGALPEDGDYYVIVASENARVLASETNYTSIYMPDLDGPGHSVGSVRGSFQLVTWPVGNFVMTLRLFPEAVDIAGLEDNHALLPAARYAKLEQVKQVDSTLAEANRSQVAQPIQWGKTTQCRLSEKDPVLVRDGARTYYKVFDFVGKAGLCALDIESQEISNGLIALSVIPVCDLIDTQGMVLTPMAVRRGHSGERKSTWHWWLPEAGEYHLVVTAADGRKEPACPVGMSLDGNNDEAFGHKADRASPTGELSLVLRVGVDY